MTKQNKKRDMKTFLIALGSVMASLTAMAESEVTLKTGTMIPLQASNAVQAADVRKGDAVLFKVARDINVDGITAVPYGTIVRGKVVKAKKSSWWGTKGRLYIDVNEIVMPNGDIIPLTDGNLRFEGKNRTALSVVLFCVVTMSACAICGSKAEMQRL